jgi:hypothetical protein
MKFNTGLPDLMQVQWLRQYPARQDFRMYPGYQHIFVATAVENADPALVWCTYPPVCCLCYTLIAYYPISYLGEPHTC